MSRYHGSEDKKIWIVNENGNEKPKNIRKKDLKKYTNDWRQATSEEVKAIEAKLLNTTSSRR
jgi:hypothetical protein